MQVEIAIGLVLLSASEFSQAFRLAMSHAAGLRRKIILLSFGLFPDRPEIHNVSHSASRW